MAYVLTADLYIVECLQSFAPPAGCGIMTDHGPKLVVRGWDDTAPPEVLPRWAPKRFARQIDAHVLLRPDDPRLPA